MSPFIFFASIEDENTTFLYADRNRLYLRNTNYQKLRESLTYVRHPLPAGFFFHFLLHGATAVVVNQKFCFFSLYKLQSSLTLLHPTLSIIFKLKSHEVRNVSCREGMKEWRSHRDRFSDFCQCL